MKLAGMIRVGLVPALAAWLGCNAIIGLELGEPGEPGSGGAAPSTSSSAAPTSGSAGGQGTAGAGGNGGADAGCIDAQEGCAPWWDPAWTRRRRLLIDLANAEALVDHPVLVRLDPSRIDYATTSPVGADLRFVSEGGAILLSHDIEAWDSGESSSIWVRVPTVRSVMESGPTAIWMYYGNPAAAVPSGPEATWDPGFTSVHHFHADLTDSTASANDGTSPAPPGSSIGPVAGARDFDGLDDHVILPDENDYDFSTALTVSAWIQVKSFTKGQQAIVTKGNDSWRLSRHNGTERLGFGTSHLNLNDNMDGNTSVNDAAWHHVAIVYDGRTKKMFVDGALDELKSFSSPIQSSSYPVAIGENVELTSRSFHGVIDEVRISSVARSDAWIAAEHRTVTVDSAVSFGVEEPGP
jgi:Concanavalin A-like lectin/glucanases superfamily/Domain of unknown function (DUF2341)